MDGALGNEIISQVYTFGSEVAHAVCCDRKECEVEFLNAVFEICILLLLSKLGGGAKPLHFLGSVSWEELMLDSDVSELSLSLS